MELHSHKETIEGAAIAHPLLGIFFLVLTPVLGIFTLAMEQTASDINLLLSIGVKLLTFVSFILTVVIYWDKITVNLRQIKEDVKEKLQRKK